MPRRALIGSILVFAVGCSVDPGPDPTPVDPAADSGPTTFDDAGPTNDAWSMPSCPGYAHDVQPLYQRHCSSCHTSGRDVHFGSSVAIARESSSACGTTMAECTIQLGQQGGSMAYRDPLGGFAPSEVAVIQSWVGCGMPN